MNRPYESMLVFDASLPEDAQTKEVEKIKSFLEEQGGFERVDVWGRRELAYDIGKHRYGYYALFLFNSVTTVPAKLEKFLKLNERVLRHSIVVRSPKAGPARQKTAEGETRPAEDAAKEATAKQE